MAGRTLDARPDRIDFRDRPYRPPLVSLPDAFPFADDVQTFLQLYLEHGKVRNQGDEGACTGFGLASVIDYIYWDRMIREQFGEHGSRNTADIKAMAGEVDELPDPVSAFMLYDAAKLYDEWDGEDYSGSSCRGALKGWHKHGVCGEALWRRTSNSNDPPGSNWRVQAARRPLGAYYRVNARSIGDLQAAIFEVRAIYCSARVHEGWQKENLRTYPDQQFAGLPLPHIDFPHDKTGGHAFCMVGYNQDGFVIQNSWGRGWGLEGFALLTYEDWIHNGNDAWVAALAAPMRVSAQAVSHSRTDQALAMTPPMSVSSAGQDGDDEAHAVTVRPWTEEKAYDHSIVLGNEGMLIRRRIDVVDAQANLNKVALEGPLKAARAGYAKLVIYAHGGLNSERAGIERAMRMGPWFEANGIYPLFLVWRTSLLESLSHIGRDFVGKFIDEREELQAEGIGDVARGAIKKLQNAFDKAFESAAEKTVGKPVWSQIKQNADAAADRGGGVRQLFNKLRELHETLSAEGRSMEIHFVGHSAGAILLGHMIDDFGGDMKLASTTLFAPACTTQFALRHYASAIKRGVLAESGIHIDALSDKIERNDTVGPYGKSLLYLVSRALETPRNLPLLGLANCLADGNPELNDALAVPGTSRQRLESAKKKIGADFAIDHIKYVRDWHDIARKHAVTTHIHSNQEVVVKLRPYQDRNGDWQQEAVKTANTHGSFDNNIEVMNQTVARILRTGQPAVPIDDLTGF